MNSGQEEELTSYLAKLGFQGKTLENDLHKQLGLNLLYFSISHKISYGEEQMVYDLKFVKDHMFNAYRMEEYKVTYRKPIEIDHGVINGIDTRELEQRMKMVDWITHFNDIHNNAKDPGQDEITQINSDLWQFDAHQGPAGIKIQEQLQLKYWPENVYDDHLKEVSKAYNYSGTFRPSAYGSANAHLVYHILSGRLNDLYEKLSQAGLEQYSGIDLYGALEKQLSGDSIDFEIQCFRGEPESYIAYSVPVTMKEGRYFVDTYTASLTPYPPIEHGIYNGIDSANLEMQMREIDWHKDGQLFIFHEDREPELTPMVERIQGQLYQLSRDETGATVADKLMLKYWPDTTFFEDSIRQPAWDYLETLPKRVQQFPIEMEAKTVFNLLCGRACLNNSRVNPTVEKGTWIQLDLERTGENGNYPLINIAVFTEKELENRLDLLPIGNMHYYPIRNALKRGDLLPVSLLDGRKVMLEADPEAKTINIYTPDMRPIYANLTLDPDWRPSLPENQKQPEKRQENDLSEQKNRFQQPHWKRHGKGKGL